ncbi:uncharacterized protein LOC131614283 [Vicia villosa]|uniref:uncharacterized protein LOC131614283 n=1 Tax=Vicia villosa TaxID=3911 RepID=UPI00273C388D|nr:uncharacterized protein LOC131614283 [Vicia villosa]
MKEDESIHDFHMNVLEIENASSALGEKIPEEKLVRKMLRFLLKRFDMKVTAIEEAQDINRMRLNDLVGSLLTFELSINDRAEKKNKSIAFVANSEDGMKECDLVYDDLVASYREMCLTSAEYYEEREKQKDLKHEQGSAVSWSGERFRQENDTTKTWGSDVELDESDAESYVGELTVCELAAGFSETCLENEKLRKKGKHSKTNSESKKVSIPRTNVKTASQDTSHVVHGRKSKLMKAEGSKGGNNAGVMSINLSKVKMMSSDKRKSVDSRVIFRKEEKFDLTKFKEIMDSTDVIINDLIKKETTVKTTGSTTEISFAEDASTSDTNIEESRANAEAEDTQIVVKDLVVRMQEDHPQEQRFDIPSLKATS